MAIRLCFIHLSTAILNTDYVVLLPRSDIRNARTWYSWSMVIFLVNYLMIARYICYPSQFWSKKSFRSHAKCRVYRLCRGCDQNSSTW